MQILNQKSKSVTKTKIKTSTGGSLMTRWPTSVSLQPSIHIFLVSKSSHLTAVIPTSTCSCSTGSV